MGVKSAKVSYVRLNGLSESFSKTEKDINSFCIMLAIVIILMFLFNILVYRINHKPLFLYRAFQSAELCFLSGWGGELEAKL